MAATRVTPTFTHVGTPEFCAAQIEFGRKVLPFAEQDCRHVARVVRGLKESRAWELMLPDEPKTWARLVHEQLGHEAEWLDQIEAGVAILERLGHSGPIQLTQALAALNARDEAQLRKPGNPNPRDARGRLTPSDHNVINRKSPWGTSRQQALRVLRTKRPDLHADVLEGRLSPHAAMVAAGLRHPTLTVPGDDVTHAVRKLIVRYGWTAVMNACTELEPDAEPT
jgi:hypothetical protein